MKVFKCENKCKEIRDVEQENKSDKLMVMSGLFWKFMERISAQAVSTIVSILLARLLSPSDYGAVGLVLVFIAIANVFVSNGLGSALVQKEEVDNVDFSSVFFINITLSIIIYTLLFWGAPIISRFYDMPILKPAIRILGIRIIIAAVNSVQQAYVSRNMLFKRFFWSTLFGTIFSGVVGIILAYRNYGLWALIVQYLINTFVSTVILWYSIPWRPILVCSWNRAKNLIKYGWKLLVSGLIDTGYTQLRGLVIGKLYTPEDLAYYNQGDKYPNLIVTNVNTSISSVLFPAMSKYQYDIERIKQMTRRAIQVSSYIMWPLLIGLAVTSEDVVTLLLTEKWLPCVPFLKIFCFTYGLWPIYTANLQAINALGRSDVFLKLEIIKKIIGIIFLIISIPFGPLSIAWSYVISGIISIFINASPNIKLLNYSLKEQIVDFVQPLIISCLMGGVVLIIDIIDVNRVFLLFIKIIAGMISYIILSFVTKQPALIYITNIMSKRKVS